jgi:hypothetical protein
MTKNSTTELTPSAEHSAAAPTFMAADGMSMQKTHERTPLAENAPTGASAPATDEAQATSVATDRSKRAVATAEQFQGAGAHVLFGT